ncbi:MAG: PaaX family transcriptional regulator C-terminal domain-containing protein, partial [Pseudorhodoplanes sp.]
MQPTARRILLTVLGDFVLPSKQPVWTASLVEAMTLVGQTEKSARQAILRASSGGWLAKSRHGKSVMWTLTPQVIELMSEGAKRVYPMHQVTAPWDGRWVVLHVSFPDEHRGSREKLYTALHWAGFGNPVPGLWVSPHTDRQVELERVVRKLGLERIVFSFVGFSGAIGANDQRIVQLSWDLDAIVRHYRSLLDQFGRPANSRGNPFANYLYLVAEWEKMPLVDPRLPNALLPANWPGQRLSAELRDLLDHWREPARAVWQQIVDKHPPPV